ncbi:MAG TPA: hypothetical protein EYQ86_09990 [Bacteroidetes bacterium]|nr:hypothetical protein [Bacteroidota bacterium]
MSCKKKPVEKIGGCMDIHSPYYDSNAETNDGSCRYIYSVEYEVTAFPDKKSNGDNWDWDITGLTIEPDLILYINKQGSSEYSFTSPSINNVTNADDIIWTSTDQFKMINEVWEWSLYDSDLDADDLVAEGSFNPVSEFTSDYISLTSNDANTNIKLYIDLRKE